jgi:hypothetical protein
MALYEDEVVIHAAVDPSILYAGARGLVPRNYETHPVGYYAGEEPFGDTDVELVPESEYADRVKELIATKSQLSDIRNHGNFGKVIPSLNQGSYGYCWGHSGTSCCHLIRAQMNQPYVPLSAFSVCATIKRGANQGGWGAQGLDYMVEHGIVPQSRWPQGNANYRQMGTEENWREAKKYRVTEGFANMNVAQYDRNLTFRQVCSCLLNRIPLIVDFNWWGHSVAAMDVVLGSMMRSAFRLFTGKRPSLQEFDRIWDMNNPETFGASIRIWNSWGDSWSSNGTGVLTGSQAVPNGCTAPRFMTMSARGARPGKPAYNFNFVKKA